MRAGWMMLFSAALLAAPVQAQDAATPDEEAPAAAEEEDVDFSKLALADIISCKIDVPSYNGFVFWFHDNEDAHKHYGLTPIKGGSNPFLSEYHLARPITVFGKTTNHVAFSSSALLAVLSDVTPQQMAGDLDVRDGGDFMGKYLAEKIVTEERIDEDDLALHGTKFAKLNVSTVSSHPDRVLVGCSYTITFDDE